MEVHEECGSGEWRSMESVDVVNGGPCRSVKAVSGGSCRSVEVVNGGPWRVWRW